MQGEAELKDIPIVLIEPTAESADVNMGALEKDEDSQEYRAFVMAFLDRLCENCKKMREQILLKAKCAGLLPEDDDNEHSVPEYLAALIPGVQLNLMDNLRRRTVSEALLLIFKSKFWAYLNFKNFSLVVVSRISLWHCHFSIPREVFSLQALFSNNKS